MDFVMFGLIPFVKKGASHEIVMMVGGPTNTTRQTFIFDAFTREVCRCAVYMGDTDKIIESNFYRVPSCPSTIILFGATLLHIFDSETHSFKAMQYISEK